MRPGRHVPLLAAAAILVAAAPGRSEPSNRLLLTTPGPGERALVTVRQLARAVAGREGVLLAALGAEERVVTRSAFISARRA